MVIWLKWKSDWSRQGEEKKTEWKLETSVFVLGSVDTIEQSFTVPIYSKIQSHTLALTESCSYNF